MSQAPVSTLQPALTLTEFLDTTGVFPPRDESGSGPFLGSIGIFAGPSFLFNTPANGQTDSILNNTALFSILGTDFGGNGTSNFELPNLGGIQTIGAANVTLTNANSPLGQDAPVANQQPGLVLNYYIALL
jgi:microcystin-dependent protein